MTEERGEGTAPEGAAQDAGEVAEPRQVTIRRAPRYRAFVLTGVAIGVLAGLVLAVGGPGTGGYSTRTLGYLAVPLALVGGLLGGLVAVLVERPRRLERPQRR